MPFIQLLPLSLGQGQAKNFRYELSMNHITLFPDIISGEKLSGNVRPRKFVSYKRSRDVNSEGLREKIVNAVGLRGVVYKTRLRHGQVTNMQKNHWTAASRDGKMRGGETLTTR